MGNTQLRATLSGQMVPKPSVMPKHHRESPMPSSTWTPGSAAAAPAFSPGARAPGAGGGAPGSGGYGGGGAGGGGGFGGGLPGGDPYDTGIGGPGAVSSDGLVQKNIDYTKLLEDKTASAEPFKYNGKGGEKWQKVMRGYAGTRCKMLMVVMDWAESMDDQEISAAMITHKVQNT